MENYPLRLNNLSYVKIKQGPFKILYFPFPKSSQISSIENYILEVMIDALHFLKIFYENFLQLRIWPLIISIRMITMIRCKDGDARERKIAAFLVRELSRSVESSSWDRQRRKRVGVLPFEGSDSNAPSEYACETGANGEAVFGTLLFSANINKAVVLFTSNGLPRNSEIQGTNNGHGRLNAYN